MPRPRKYTDEMIGTPNGSSLYALWLSVKRRPHSRDFNTFDGFYNWALESGYFEGANLARYDTSDPFSPDNCTWRDPVPDRPIYGDEAKAWIAKWNAMVNDLRKKFGLEPLTEIKKEARKKAERGKAEDNVLPSKMEFDDLDEEAEHGTTDILV